MIDKILRADSSVIANIKRCKYTEQVNAVENLRCGAAVASSIVFEAYGAQTDAPAVGEVLTYYQTDENGIDTLIGKFIAQPSIHTKNTFTVVAYDNIILLETDFSEHLESIQSNFPMTLSALLTEVATVSGVTFGNSPALASTTIQAFSGNVTCRQIVSWAAEMSGQFVRCDTSGEIEFSWYEQSGTYSSNTQSGSVVSFDDGAGLNVSALTVAIEPVQSGSGTPYPDNVRPISGFDSASIKVSPTADGAGTIYNVSFGGAGTVYGGTLDVTNGTLTVDRASTTIGSLTWAKRTGGQGRYDTAGINTLVTIPATATVNVGITCEFLPPETAGDIYNGTVGIGVNTDGRVWLHLSDMTLSAADFTSTYGAYRFVYPLATSQTYQLTPTQVRTLVGQNYISSDAGDVTVTYLTFSSNYLVYKTSGNSGTMTYVPYRENGLDYKDYAVDAVDRVAVIPAGVDGVAYLYPNGVTGNTYSISNNLLLTDADSTVMTSVAQTVYNALTALPTYRPCTINLFRFDNPFRAGEIIAVEDIQGVSFTTLAMSMSVDNGGALISCTGQQTYAADSGSTVSDKLVNLASDIVRINKLKVDWAEINTAIINYLTAYDVTAQNITIVDASDNVLATFNDTGITFYNGGVAVANFNNSTVTLGETTSTHAEIDFNSFELYDKNGNLYTSIGDMRDSSGYATLTQTTVTESATYTVTTAFNIRSVDSITIDGVATTAYTYNLYTVTFTNQIPANSTVVITYKTNDNTYHFDLGKRKSGSVTGAWSVANGSDAEASSNYTTVSGGQNNTASKSYATVGGGAGNTSSGYYSSVGGGGSNTANNYGTAVSGGYNNTASGNYATVGGGYTNTANGDCAVVPGGNTNTASGKYSTAVGGESNTASGYYSSVLGGNNNEAHRQSQVVFGEYNIVETGVTSTRGNYVEIVGNGTTDNARSNARTLDWNGNETLAGKLYVNGGDEAAAWHNPWNVASSYPTTYGRFAVQSNIFSHMTPGSNYGVLTIEGIGGYQRHVFTNHLNEVWEGWRENVNAVVEPAAWVQVGTPTYSSENSSTVSVATATTTSIKNVTLSAGIYLVSFGANFAQNATGYRAICVSTDTTFNGAAYPGAQRIPAVNGGSTWLSLCVPYNLTASTTLYFLAYQNSGSALSVSGQYRIVKLV